MRGTGCSTHRHNHNALGGSSMSRLRLASALLAAALLAATLARAQALPRAEPEDVGLSKQRLAKLGEVLRQEVEQGRLPGAVVLVARKGKLAYAEALGWQDKGQGVPMALDSIFRLYSMTKPLASVALMQLVEDGKVQLTDPVSKFLPAFKNQAVSVAQVDAEFAKITYTQVPAAREMTIHDLLRHTAGLAYGEITQNAPVKEAYAKAGLVLPGVRDYDSRGMTPQEQVERLAKAPLAHQPGTVFEYSLAVDLQGRVVEAVTGRRLAEAMRERIFAPLGMRDTGFWVPAEKLQRLAEPLPTDPFSGQPNKLIDVTAVPGNDSGGAGGVGTAGDYLRFCEAMLDGGQLDGARILGRSTVRLMTSDHLGTRIAAPVQPGEMLLGTQGYTFGLGFAVRQGDGLAGVQGSGGDFTWAGYAGTYFWADPKEQLCVVYMTQAPGAMRAYYRKLVRALVYQALE
jgi:CubicO group peptidase (beta-lactamase class C family)